MVRRHYSKSSLNRKGPRKGRIIERRHVAILSEAAGPNLEPKRIDARQQRAAVLAADILRKESKDANPHT
jgi:hypothetical protein